MLVFPDRDQYSIAIERIYESVLGNLRQKGYRRLSNNVYIEQELPQVPSEIGRSRSRVMAFIFRPIRDTGRMKYPDRSASPLAGLCATARQ